MFVIPVSTLSHFCIRCYPQSPPHRQILGQVLITPIMVVAGDLKNQVTGSIYAELGSVKRNLEVGGDISLS